MQRYITNLYQSCCSHYWYFISTYPDTKDVETVSAYTHYSILTSALILHWELFLFRAQLHCACVVKTGNVWYSPIGASGDNSRKYRSTFCVQNHKAAQLGLACREQRKINYWCDCLFLWAFIPWMQLIMGKQRLNSVNYIQVLISSNRLGSDDQ